MKLLLFISTLLISFNGNASQNYISNNVKSQEQSISIQSDSLLFGIQDKIYNAFVNKLISPENDELNQLSNELEQLYITNDQNLILYWQSYLQFYSSVYYLKQSNKKAAEKEIDKGINCLKNMKNKNSEDYALLSMLQGFSIQFKAARAMFIGPETKENAKKAMALDSANLRAYYVYASNDFYTPKKYGGGKEAEKHLLKAISLPDQKVKNEYLPNWGKEESYEMLIRIYIKKEKWDLARKYFHEGIKEYPDSYTIHQLELEEN